MKRVCIALILVIAIITSGCTGTARATAPADTTPAATPATYPDLRGSWTGPMEGYDQGTGYSTYPGIGVIVNVTEQHGRILGGNLLVLRNDDVTTYGFAGAIGRDGRSLYLSEVDGYVTGEIVSDNEIELIYQQAGTNYSTAIDSFHRV